jgi:hypothetical protein
MVRRIMKVHAVHARLPITLLVAALVGIAVAGASPLGRSGGSTPWSVRADVGWNSVQAPQV